MLKNIADELKKATGLAAQITQGDGDMEDDEVSVTLADGTQWGVQVHPDGYYAIITAYRPQPEPTFWHFPKEYNPRVRGQAKAIADAVQWHINNTKLEETQ